MTNYNELVDLFIDNIKKLFYPEEWIDIDLSFSKSELFALLILDRHKEIIMSQIADYISIPMSTATGVVDRLVKNGYLKRERSESDRRIVVIRLTDKGQELVDKFKKTLFKYIELINSNLTDEERNILFKVFFKVLNILNKTNEEYKDTDIANDKVKKIDIE